MDRRSMVNIRGLAVICVVLIHITSGASLRGEILSNDSLNVLLNTISRFCVPIFFISSGFGTDLNSNKYLNLKEYYVSKLKIFIEFMCWSMLYGFLRGYSFRIQDLIKILIGESFYHLYFIPALLLCYLIYPMIAKLFYSKEKLLILIGVGLILQFLNYRSAPFPYFQLYGFILYFVLGVYLQRSEILLNKLKEYSIMIFSLGILFLISDVTFNVFFTDTPMSIVTTSLKPSVFIYSLGTLLLFIVYFNKPNKFFRVLDRNSLGIYYVHPIFLTIFSKISILFDFKLSNDIIAIFIKLIVALFFSQIFSFLLFKLKGFLVNFSVTKSELI